MPFSLDILTSSSVLAMIGGIGPIELIIALAILLLVLGPSKLPRLGAAIGKSYGNLKKGIREGKDEEEANQAEEVAEGVEVKVEVQAPEALEAQPVESAVEPEAGEAEAGKAEAGQPEAEAVVDGEAEEKAQKVDASG